ncbi:MAG: tRNA pseudouridine(38-40) synthase TruA [Actinomycetota bacterium]|nr:tRNA pseudouridine(38-40) synthase TruA [Actinomycetota bacterium]
MRTVQGDLEAALTELFDADAPVVSYAAGRTDAGVHALGQVMSVPETPDNADLAKLRDSLNTMCGPHIAVQACARAAPDFHARFSARSRTYVYAILQRDHPDPFLAGTTLYHPKPLDIHAINEAAGHLLGPHDFISFGRVSEPDAPSERNLYELVCTRSGPIITIKARASSFIQQMVRSVVGILIQTGQGRRSPDEMPGILAARRRDAAGPVAAAHGLCLVSVEYDTGWSDPEVV